ncbi:hypothetical protein ABMA27_013834 [Loxostege sticticalis]|uniref:Putative ionotropic receptor ligand binding domain-containing protein n=1 Tax=Loxostege sticticalis TaxID=481309 RepID=A0ABR3IBN5_LOXSC
MQKEKIPIFPAISIVYSDADVNYLIEGINNLESYSIIVRSFYNRNWLIDTDSYIMLTENVEELAAGMSQITLETFWDPRSKIVVHVNNLTKEEINKVFDIFLNHRTYNVILVTNSYNDADIYTYDPFENGYCGKQFNDAKLVTSCKSYKIIDQYFPKQNENRFRNCSAKVLVGQDIPNIIIKPETNQHVDGVEHYLLQNIAKVEGVTLEFKISDIGFGVVLPNHTCTGLLAFLQNNEADIAASGFILIKNRADVFDFVYGYSFATLNVFTPALNTPVWEKLYKEFDYDIWILVFVYFVIITVISTVVLNLAPKLYDQHSGLLLQLWGFFYIGNSSVNLLKVKRLRLVLTCWIWFTFFISNFYTTALYSLVTAQVRQSQEDIKPENLQSLKPLKPCISSSIRTYFLFAFHYEFPENVPLAECDDVEKSLDAVANKKDLYAIEMTYSYELREDRYFDNDGNRELDAWKFSSDNTFTLYLSKGFPLTKKFQKLSQRMFESGLIEYYKNFIIYHTQSAFEEKANSFKKIKLAHFKNHYIVLIIGYVASSICLFLEICVKHYMDASIKRT